MYPKPDRSDQTPNFVRSAENDSLELAHTQRGGKRVLCRWIQASLFREAAQARDFRMTQKGSKL